MTEASVERGNTYRNKNTKHLVKVLSKHDGYAFVTQKGYDYYIEYKDLEPV